MTVANQSGDDKPINLAAECPSYIERLFLPGISAAIETNLALNALWQAGAQAAGADL